MKITPLLFRFHRGLLEESMQTMREVHSFEQLIIIIVCEWEFEPIEIQIQKYIYDDRIQWDTHIVLGKFRGLNNSGYAPIGFLNRAPNWMHPQGEKIEVFH